MKKFSVNIMYRLFEIVGGCIAMSAFVCMLCVSGLMPVGSIQRDIALTLLSPIFVVWNIVVLRRNYIYLHNKMKFYKVNLFVNIIFALISVLAYIIGPKELYSWFFLVTYLFGFSNIAITPTVSLLVFHAVIAISIFISPIGMDWVYEENKRMQQYIETLPPMLEINPLEEKTNNTEEQHEKENQEKTQNNMSEL